MPSWILTLPKSKIVLLVKKFLSGGPGAWLGNGRVVKRLAKIGCLGVAAVGDRSIAGDGVGATMVGDAATVGGNVSVGMGVAVAAGSGDAVGAKMGVGSVARVGGALTAVARL